MPPFSTVYICYRHRRIFIYRIPLQAQTYNMANGTINTCSGTFYDPWSGRNYTNNLNLTQTICSNAGNCLTVNFTASELRVEMMCWVFMTDRIQLLLLIGVFRNNFSGFCQPSSSGCPLLLLLQMEVIVFRWTASISWAVVVQLIWWITIQQWIPGGLFYDSGGSGGIMQTVRILPKHFVPPLPDHACNCNSAFALKANDILTVYNGNSVASPLIGAYTGTTLPPTMLSSSGCLTVNFTSNNASVDIGWAAIITCEICPSTPAGSATYTSDSRITKYLCWKQHGEYMRRNVYR